MYTHKDNTKEDKKNTSPYHNTNQSVENESVFHFEDNSPRAIQMRKLQEMANNNPQAIQMRKLQEMANNNPQAIQMRKLQEMANNNQQSIIQKENNTGLPDQLKTGIENLSGYSLDDVKVHYNSDKPAQLHAHAYAQGTEIHIATRQEKHLPHEAWHVVQQKQGRVKPTMQLKGEVNINDEAGLEKEADVMGVKAMQKTSFLNELKIYSQKKDTLQQRVIQRMTWDTFVKEFPHEKASMMKESFWKKIDLTRNVYEIMDDASQKGKDVAELDAIAEILRKNPVAVNIQKYQRKYDTIPEKEKQDVANVIMLTRATLGMPLNKKSEQNGIEHEISTVEMSQEQSLVKKILNGVEEDLLAYYSLTRNDESPIVVLILAVASDIVGGGVCDNFASLAAVYSKKLYPKHPIWLMSTGGHRYAATGESAETLDHPIDAWYEKRYAKKHKTLPGVADKQEFNVEQLNENYEKLKEQGTKYYYSLLDTLTLPELILLAARLEEQIAHLVQLLQELND